MADGSSGKTKSIDELLADAAKLRKQVGQTSVDARKTEVKSTPIGDALNNVKAFNDTAKEVHGGVALMKEASRSTWSFIKRSWPGRAYGWLWRKICYKKNKETGEKVFRPKRAIGMALTTAFMATAVIPGGLGTPARTVLGAVTEPIYDGARMATMMHREEVMYLNDQHVVDHSNNVWVVKGTTHQNGDVNDAVLFKVKPSLAHDIWSWSHKGNPFFIPDQVVAPVAPGANNKYVVTYYGVRWRIANWLQAYPELLDVRAVPADFNKAAEKTPAPEQKEQKSAPAPVQQQAPTNPAPKAPAPR